MDKIESLTAFYKRKFDWMPGNIDQGIGHFNVFRLDPLVDGKSQPVAYKRRDFYKVMLVVGNSQVHYADKVVEVKNKPCPFPILGYPINGSTWTIIGRAFIVYSTNISFIKLLCKHVNLETATSKCPHSALAAWA